MLRWDQIRASIARRTVLVLPSSMNNEVALDLALSQPLEGDVLTRLTMDGINASRYHHDNRMSALRIYASTNEVRIVLPPIGRQIMRLETFLSHQRAPRRLPAEIAAYLVETIARVIGDFGSGHGYLTKR